MIDLKMGLVGAVFMGGLVFWVNIDYGLGLASIAALKQFTYTFFFGGLFLKMAENLATNQENRYAGIVMGGVMPMILTAMLTFALHSAKGTPEPLYSTLPTIIFATISFTSWSWFKTRK